MITRKIGVTFFFEEKCMFGKRLNLCTFAGIRIGVDISWIFIALLLSWTLASGYFPFLYPELSLQMYWTMGIAGMLGLFLCILLHELGHALVAKHYKLPISQITLFIFGGVAEIKKEPTRPKVEFFMALAGPLVSLALVAGLVALTYLGIQMHWPILIVGVTKYLAMINAVIVIFNLIPAFPLDGGRIFRALLWWWKKDFAWATRISTRLGTGFGFLLIFLGIFSTLTGNFITGMWFIILGWFLSRSASTSRNQLLVNKQLEHEKVSRLMTKAPITVPPDITITQFIEDYVYTSHHHLYPVTDKNRLLGYISLTEVKSLSRKKWDTTAVQDSMVPLSAFRTISPSSNALEALNLMQQMDTPTLLVTENNRLVGILTAPSLFKILSLHFELSSK
jgi:Zn-dependent protease/predicted transcriptional regulator